MSARNKKFLLLAVAVMAAAFAFSFQPALAAKTWKLVTPSAGGASGGDGWSTSCAMYGGNTTCIRTNGVTGDTQCKYNGNYGYSGAWGDCGAGSPFSGVGGIGGGGVNNDGIMTGGFFVLSHNSWDGNLGGLAGANAKCVSDLLTYPWKGKGSAGDLSAPGRVQAFLCNGTTCNNAQPFTQYRFATANDVNRGGLIFTTDENGRGPNNTNYWYENNIFGNSVTYWSSRASSGSSSVWPLNSESTVCSGWTSNVSGAHGFAGYTGTNNEQRWRYTTPTCNTTHRLICMIHPE